MSDSDDRASGPVDALEGLRLRALGLLAAVFVAGALAGAAAVQLWPESGRPDPGGPPPGAFRGIPGELPPPIRRLDLTEDQRERIRTILQEARPRSDSILRVALPRLRAIADSVRAEIWAVLTPAQRERLARQAPAFGRRGRDGPRPPLRGPGAPGGGPPP